MKDLNNKGGLEESSKSKIQQDKIKQQRLPNVKHIFTVCVTLILLSTAVILLYKKTNANIDLRRRRLEDPSEIYVEVEENKRDDLKSTEMPSIDNPRPATTPSERTASGSKPPVTNQYEGETQPPTMSTGKNDEKEERRNSYIASEKQRLEFHRLVADKLYAANIHANLLYLSKAGHMAGTHENNARGDWIASHFRNHSLDNVIVKSYDVLLSYPLGPGNLTLFNSDGSEKEKFSVVEKKLDNFEMKTKTKVYPPFLAYTASGNVEGEMVYANFGTEFDFEQLKKMNIDVKDKIVLIRYGGISRNKKIKYAEQYDVKGVILFSDPDTYSPTGVHYPDSWYLPPDGVQRGTLLRMRGDPLSRGYPAIDGLYKRPIDEVSYFPKVPVQPLGYGDAEKLLKSLDGEEPPSDKWHGALNISYHVSSKDKRKVRLHVNVTREIRPIKNIIGVIRGAVEPDRIVIVGNHRDAWTYGAADPSSGTAVMVEVSRALGWLKKKHGWKPRRTIMLCSWDAEEYGLLGSTEWTQEHAKILTHQAVAYINVDTAVQGNHTIELKSTPELVDIFFDAAKKFKDPDSSENLYTTWVKKHKKDREDKRKEPKVRMFREGSDYMPFYGDLGIPSMDFRYMFSTKDQGVFNYPVYHTIHDNIDWLTKFVDPDFRYHTTIAKVWTQLILLLADTTLLPFNFIRYSDSLRFRVNQMADITKQEGVDTECDYTLLKSVVEELSNATKNFHERLKDLDKTDALAVRIANDQMVMFERTFVTSEDIPGEPSTRHIYHTAGLAKALRNVIKNRTSPKLLREFKVKYSIYTYHVMMAIHALKNPFTTPTDDDSS